MTDTDIISSNIALNDVWQLHTSSQPPDAHTHLTKMNQTVSCSRHPTACFCFCHLLASFPRIRLAPLPALMSLSTTVCFPSVLVWWPNRDLLIFTRFCTCYSLICLYFVRNLCFRFHRLVPDQIICLVFYRLLISVYFAI